MSFAHEEALAESPAALLRHYRVPILIVLVGTLLSITAYIAVLSSSVNDMQKNFRFVTDVRTQALQNTVAMRRSELELAATALGTQAKPRTDGFHILTSPLVGSNAFAAVLWIEHRNGRAVLRHSNGSTPPEVLAKALRFAEGMSEEKLLLASPPLAADAAGGAYVALVAATRTDGVRAHVAGILRTEDFLRPLAEAGQQANERRVYVYDAALPETPLYSADPQQARSGRMMNPGGEAPSLAEVMRFSSFHIENTISLPGRSWRAVFLPGDTLISQAAGFSPWVMLAGGLVIVALLGFERFQAATSDIRSSREVATKTRALTESEIRLRNVINHTVDGLITVDPQGIVESFNPACETMFGYPAREAIGRHIGMILPEAPRAAGEPVEGYFAPGSRREAKGRRKDGQIFPIELSVSEVRLQDGRVFYSGMLRDITERLEAKRKLEDAHKYLEDMLNHIPDPIFMKDRQHRWIGGNRAFWQLMDGSPEKFLGKSDYDFFPKEEANAFWEKDNRVFTSGEVDISEEFFTDSKGERHVFSTKKMAFLNTAGEQFLVGIIRDITERKQAEDEREKLISHLSVSNAELERFAYICSHDLQEPLRMMSNYTQRLEKHLQDRLDDKAVHYMAYITEGAARARTLISDVLAYARVDAAPQKAETVDMMRAFSMATGNLHGAITEAGAEVTSGVLPHVMAHPTHMLQLLQNLISNAIKFRGEEAPRVRIESGQADGGFWRFSVSDNGIGIAPEYQSKLFTLFQRLHGRHEYPGTGIGLAVCKKIVQQYGGRIWVESEAGKGASFHFTLPGVHAGTEGGSATEHIEAA